jgi:hypothetical protein
MLTYLRSFVWDALARLRLMDLGWLGVLGNSCLEKSACFSGALKLERNGVWHIVRIGWYVR